MISLQSALLTTCRARLLLSLSAGSLAHQQCPCRPEEKPQVLHGLTGCVSCPPPPCCSPATLTLLPLTSRP